MGATWIAVSPDVPVECDYYICQCIDAGGPFADCGECSGTGAVVLGHTAGEMHLTYGNTIALTRALGFACDDEAYVFDFTYEDVKLIASTNMHRLEGDLRERYWSALSTLCAVALRYKCGINWG